MREQAACACKRWSTSALDAGVTTPAMDFIVGAPQTGTEFGFDVDSSARMAVVTLQGKAYFVDLSGDAPVIISTTPSAASRTKPSSRNSPSAPSPLSLVPTSNALVAGSEPELLTFAPECE